MKLQGLRREVEEKTREAGTRRGNGDAGNQNFLERSGRRPPDTLMVKVTMSGRQVNNSRRDSEVPGEDGEEIESPRRTVIRVESEETHDSVREANDLNQQEAEELSFVPSAISVPQKPFFSL